MMFKVGDTVEALTTAQGMTEGQTYKVIQVQTDTYPWAVYATYHLEGYGRAITVRNAHLLLRRVQ